jgi:hypothetical protein
MATYAVHDGVSVVNVIVADTAQIAEEVTGLTALETEGVPWIGWTLHGDEWRPPMPADGVWEWDDVAHDWVDVTPAPGE